MIKRLASLVIFSLAYSGHAGAQAVSSADVNIVSVQAEAVKDRFVCTAEINNQNDDDSYGTQVIVLLPLEVKITNMTVLQGSGSCRKSAATGEPWLCNLQSRPSAPRADHQAYGQDYDNKVGGCSQLSADVCRIYLQQGGRYSEGQ